MNLLSKLQRNKEELSLKKKIINKNLNSDDYKEVLMKKHNLTEAEWKKVSDFARILLKSDDISVMLPFML